MLFTCIKSWFFRNHLANFHQISHWSFCWNVIDSLFKWSCSIDCQAHIFFFKTKNCSNDDIFISCDDRIGKMLHNICMSAVAMSLRWANCGPWASCLMRTHDMFKWRTRENYPRMIIRYSFNPLNNNLISHTHFWLSANQITSYNDFIQIHKLNDRQWKSHLIWIYTVCKGRVVVNSRIKVNISSDLTDEPSVTGKTKRSLIIVCTRQNLTKLF